MLSEFVHLFDLHLPKCVSFHVKGDVLIIEPGKPTFPGVDLSPGVPVRLCLAAFCTPVFNVASQKCLSEIVGLVLCDLLLRSL